jgi:CRP-like cAMP-binding protein
MPLETPLADETIAPLLDRLPEQSSLFRGIDRQALGDLLRQAGHRVHLARGENLITEGDDADALYFIESGRFEVRKLSDRELGAAEHPGDGGHRIGEALPGTVVGEVALLDRGKRSATVRALEPSVALVLRMGDLERAVRGAPHPAVQMQLNLAHEMAQKIRHSTSSAVRHLEQSLLEAQKRVEMGRFMSRTLIGTCLYIYALVLMEPLKAMVPDTTVLSVLILLGFAFGLWLNIRTSMFPASAYGFNLDRWRAALAEAVLFSLPFLVLVVVLKWALLATSPALAGHSLFDFYRHKGLGARSRWWRLMRSSCRSRRWWRAAASRAR